MTNVVRANAKTHSQLDLKTQRNHWLLLSIIHSVVAHGELAKSKLCGLYVMACTGSEKQDVELPNVSIIVERTVTPRTVTF